MLLWSWRCGLVFLKVELGSEVKRGDESDGVSQEEVSESGMCEP